MNSARPRGTISTRTGNDLRLALQCDFVIYVREKAASTVNGSHAMVRPASAVVVHGQPASAGPVRQRAQPSVSCCRSRRSAASLRFSSIIAWKNSGRGGDQDGQDQAEGVGPSSARPRPLSPAAAPATCNAWNASVPCSPARVTTPRAPPWPSSPCTASTGPDRGRGRPRRSAPGRPAGPLRNGLTPTWVWTVSGVTPGQGALVRASEPPGQAASATASRLGSSEHRFVYLLATRHCFLWAHTPQSPGVHDQGEDSIRQPHDPPDSAWCAVVDKAQELWTGRSEAARSLRHYGQAARFAGRAGR